MDKNGLGEYLTMNLGFDLMSTLLNMVESYAGAWKFIRLYKDCGPIVYTQHGR